MISGHFSSFWALLATFIVGFVLGAVVQPAFAKWKLRRDLDLTGDPEPMEWNPEEMSDEELYEKFGIWPGKKGLPPKHKGHVLTTRLQGTFRDRLEQLKRKS